MFPFVLVHVLFSFCHWVPHPREDKRVKPVKMQTQHMPALWMLRPQENRWPVSLPLFTTLLRHSPSSLSTHIPALSVNGTGREAKSQLPVLAHWLSEQAVPSRKGPHLSHCCSPEKIPCEASQDNWGPLPEAALQKRALHLLSSPALPLSLKFRK